ncbi:MAG TPA: 3-dehydroquinate synthase [Kiloniellaceae bacterium]|nr:3-dehydroquinate synthase [Kiloniellaceae bacterium]
MSEERRLSVDLGTRSYDILIGSDLIGRAGALVAPLLQRRRVFVVTDENVAGHHLRRLVKSFEAQALKVETRILAPGEATKSVAQLADLVDWLLGQAIERRDLVIAFGGGVIGDLAGFAAAVTLRGIPFVQIPTTLLSQVDSSVGGKTGINSPWGKNLIGAFYQPRLVLADSSCLTTLPRRELLAGYAEVVKYGALGDAAFFAWLEANGQRLLGGDDALLHEAIHRSCRAKADVVAADELEAGRRALLNLGHTFGHALEAECGYGGEILHGEAVAIGMVMAADLSVRLGLCPESDAARLRRHLEAVGLPTAPPELPGRPWNTDRLLDHMSRDKKVSDGKCTFVLLRRIGEAFLDNRVAEDDLRAILAHAA